MTRLVRLFIGLMLVTVLAVTGVQAAKVGGKGVTTLANGTVEEALAAFADQTIVLERPKDTKGYRRDRVIAVEGRFVGYFSPNGRLLVWSKDSDKVIAASWGIGPGGNLSQGPDSKTGPLLCLSFTEQSGRQPCIVIRYMDEYLFDSAKGNVFNLKAGAAVPAALPRSPSKLSRISAAIGQGN